MVVGPAFVWPLLKENPLELIWSVDVIRHGIGQDFGILAGPRESHIVFSVGFKKVRAFNQSGGWKITYGCGLFCQLGPVIVEFGYINSPGRPYEVSLAVVIDKNAGVNTKDPFNWLFPRCIRTLRPVGHCNSDPERTKIPRLAITLHKIREKEMIFPVMYGTVRCPHGISFRVPPWNVFLVQDHSVVCPIGQILR